MEEEHFPPRSERHKKSGAFASKRGGGKDKHAKRTGGSEAGETQRSSLGSDWYFTDPAPAPEPPRAPAQEEHAALPARAPRESGAGASGPAPSGKGRRRRLTPAATVLLLLLMLVGGACCGYAAVNAILPSDGTYVGGNLDRDIKKNINILVLGCDEREGDTAGRADVIMVATIRPDAKKVSVFSIPRDTRVSIEGHGEDKINHAMAYGGIPLIRQTVSQMLGVRIDYYVKVNFDGFINVIDALGGVNIDVPERMYKPLEAIDLEAGYQTLNGAESLAFVRWRGDGTGDYGRIERQQQFLSALMDKVKNMSMGQALDVAGAVMDSIETDMKVREMTSYGINLLGIGSEDVKTYSFIGETLWLNGVNYVEPDMDAIADIVYKMQHGEPEAADAEPADTDAAGAGTQSGEAVQP